MTKYLSKLLWLSIITKIIVINGNPLTNLEENIDSFIIEEKQIVIPGYPGAFNPSIIRWEDGRLLLIFRVRDPLTRSTHLMGFVWLNEDFELEGDPILLTIYGDRPLKISKAQDPRLIKSGDYYYIAYNNILNDNDLETRRMVICPLNYQDGRFFIVAPDYILSFVGDSKNWIEKNWAPFDYKGELHFSYSFNPHRVFKLSEQKNKCDTVAVSKANINWKWGELRGGTPSLLDGDHYLGFFHSFINMKSVQSNGEKISHYFMGAYLFESKYPFALTHISPKPIIGHTFYTPPDYPTWKPLRAIFPSGFVFNDDFIWVVYGRQDHECWVVKLDKKSLMNSLLPVLND